MSSKGERTRQKICQTAVQLFSEKGYKDVSMQDICNVTGLSKGGLYRHFSNKGELLLELIKKEKRVLQDIENGVSAAEALENLLFVYREDMRNYKDSLAYALFEYITTDGQGMLDSKNTADKEYWHRLVAYGVQTGEFNDIEPDVVMDVFLYAYRGIMMWGRALPFEEETLDHITDAVRCLLIKNYRGKTV